MKIRSISLRFFTSFCHSVCVHRIPFEGILHNGAKITLPILLFYNPHSMLTLECALKYSTMASYVIFYANNKYNNYNYTLDKDSLWNSNSNKTFIKLIKSIRDRRQNHSTTLSNCVSI